MTAPQLLMVSDADKARLKLLFLAKHALSGGSKDAEDGNHAVYHHELYTTIAAAGFDVTPANDFSVLFEGKGFDFLFPMLNRAGFPMSEMLGPLLGNRLGLPYVGASPIIRGLSDDKHLMKVLADRAGVPVTPWQVYRIGGLNHAPPYWNFAKLVVKPNASSASWGIGVYATWAEAEAHIRDLHAQHYDAIVEEFFGDYDLVIPVVGHRTPWVLPTSRVVVDDAHGAFWTYEEKRGLTDVGKERRVVVDDAALNAKVHEYISRLLPELWPLDFGRFEFRYDPANGDLRFMEVNLSCNLWSKKTISWSAQQYGFTHHQLVEHIIAQSMERQGLITAMDGPQPAAD